MFTGHSLNVRNLLTVGAIFMLFVMQAPVSTQVVNVTSSAAPAAMPTMTADAASQAIFDLKDSSGLWILFGGALALTIGFPVVGARFGRKRALQTSSEADAPLPLFPNYLELRKRARLSLRFWFWARMVVVAAMLVYVVVLFAAPSTGLFLWWRLTVPLLPMLFLVAPGVWRNVCPLAASNQTPRLFKITRALTPPAWFKRYSFIIGVAGFFVLASGRKWLFNTNGPATGVLILAALGGAWLGGYLFKGKSGWCTSICPLYPVQRLYNQTPLVTIPNAHCTPCVGCTKNCYDFNPSKGYLADLHDEDPRHVNDRKFFAAAMPGFIVAFFTVADPTTFSGTLAMYAQFILYVVISVGIFNWLETILPVSTNKITAVYAATAFNLFYWFSVPSWLSAVGSVWGVTISAWFSGALQAGIMAMTLVWIARTYRKEALYIEQFKPNIATSLDSATIPTLIPMAMPAPALAPVSMAQPAQSGITFMPDQTQVPIEAGRSLLEIAESHHQPIEAGCRMGVCGADPVLIVNGMENLPPLGNDEKSTLERLGLGPNCRLACMCRVKGPVTVAVNPRAAIPVAANTTAVVAPPSTLTPVTDFDRTIKRVVIIGNGVAGVTAADTVRRHHPECEIHLISREKHHFYNRMGITRLIYGRSAMTGLYLQSEAWYDERNITCWLNTHVTDINRGHKQVSLATGETLTYDRLILANGSSSFVPPIPGYGLPGTFVLRAAEEAMEIRSYVQQHQCRTAVVAGGGLLGLEAAYALHKLGLTVWVLELGEWLLRRQLDARGAACLKRYLEAMGLIVETRSAVSEVQGDGRITQVTLQDGRVLPCDVFVVAAGIRPNVDLARAAGLRINRGVLVDDKMCTNAPDIFAAGDVCEFNQQVPGLWPVAADQAKVAAINAVGGKATYQETVPVTMLKVVGVDMTSIGRFEKQSEAEIEIALEDVNEQRYRKLVVADGKLVGAILLGYPQDAAMITDAVKANRDVRHQLDALRTGHWEVLQDPGPSPTLIGPPKVEVRSVTIEPPLRERLTTVLAASKRDQPIFADALESRINRFRVLTSDILRSSRRVKVNDGLNEMAEFHVSPG